MATPSLATATAFVLAFAAAAIGASAFSGSSGTLAPAGLDARPDYAAALAGADMAVLAFAVALLVGFRLTDSDLRPPARLLVWASGVILAAVLAICIVVAGADMSPSLLVIALSAGVLAFQTAGARRITELASVPSREGHVWRNIGSIPTLVAGALTGLAIVTTTPSAAPLISAAAAIGAIVLVRRVDLHRR